MRFSLNGQRRSVNTIIELTVLLQADNHTQPRGEVLPVLQLPFWQMRPIHLTTMEAS